ncbi:MFS transporter [Rothia nasimurium]|uniref:MFS transporter n=1 Tax=Rothia nasimurium TaxID=85336 RepID=UPI001EFF8368|nr:MFS transporter [Rothia nasimurium]
MSPHRNPNNRSTSPLAGIGYRRHRRRPLEATETLGSSMKDSVGRLGVSAKYARTRIQGILLAHGWRFLVFSLLMRLPTAMVMLAVMMMLSDQNREATLGGYAAGTVGLGAALMIPVYRSISDRWGQRRIFFTITLLNIMALLWLMLESLRFSETANGSITRFLIACALSGLTTVPLGTVMRSYWSAEYQATKDRRKLNASISLETIFDVTAIPAGAALAGITTLALTAQFTLFAVILINVLGLLMLLWRPENLPIETRVVSDNPRKPLRGGNRSLIWIPQVGSVFLGLSLGATQASIVSFTISTDQMEVTGFLIALLGVSAVAAALFVIFERLPMFGWSAWIISGIFLTITSMMLSLPVSTLGMIPALIGMGLAYGICLVTMDSITASLTARHNLDLALATLQAGSLGGIAVGFVWAADLSGLYNYQVALLVPILAAVIYFCIGHFYGFRWRRAYEERLSPLP